MAIPSLIVDPWYMKLSDSLRMLVTQLLAYAWALALVMLTHERVHCRRRMCRWMCWGLNRRGRLATSWRRPLLRRCQSLRLPSTPQTTTGKLWCSVTKANTEAV